MKKVSQPFPRAPYAIEKIGDVERIVDRFGNDVMREPNGMQRLIECANALSDVWFPLNHVPATEDYVKRLEESRREAWAALGLALPNVSLPLEREGMEA
jgi:hypothetical protein